MAMSEAWENETECLDAIALTIGISDHVNCARRHAWEETDYARIWAELTDCLDEIADLHVLLQQTWEKLYTAASREARGES